MPYNYEFFRVDLQEPVAILWLNKPEKRNAMDWSFWRDLPLVVKEIQQDEKIRAYVIAGEGKSFSTGLDLNEFFHRFSSALHGKTADEREKLLHLILKMQEGMNAIQDSSKPCIAAIHKHCIGGGLDLIAACDIRYATKDSIFSLREAKLGIVADMGSLNRLPYIIGGGYTRELALTAKDISGEEAFRIGLVTKLFDSKDDLLKGAHSTALAIASNPAIAIRGVKKVLNYCQDKSIKDGLEYVAAYNAGLLDSLDLQEAYNSFRDKKKPEFNRHRIPTLDI